MKRIVLLLPLFIALVCLLPPASSRAARSGTEWPRLALAQMPFEADAPVFLTHAGDGSGRMFLVEQPGVIRVVKNGMLLPDPFLDISDQVIFQGEQGLLSMAFSPNYRTNGEFYVNFTERTSGGDTHIVLYRVSAQEPDIADPASAETVLVVEQPYVNHNGGQLQFGPDGMLYIGMGDGGSGGDPHIHAQNPATLLGEMLRIDVESGSPTTYTIPPDNPYVGQAGYRGEIWQLGLRNPWRFSFDRTTGDMYIGDVGQGQWEEINFQPGSSQGGENWGWRCYEGTHEFDFSQCVEGFPYSMPVAGYSQAGGGCAVTGGYVYRGATYERMQGVYFYADYCAGTVWGLRNAGGTGWVNRPLGNAGFGLGSFGEDEAGNLYLLNTSNGSVWKLNDLEQATYLPAIVTP